MSDTPEPPAVLGAAAGELDRALRDAGSPERADHERRYLKSRLEHYGTSVPAIRRVATDFARRHPGMDHDTVVRLAEELWSEPVHERRMAAVELLDLYSPVLTADDMGWLEERVRTSGTWALVDPLAVSVAGAVVARHPSAAEVLDRWAADADFWVRRAALLALLVPLRQAGGDFERFGRYADTMLEDREPFIRKAIGWVLRDTARKRPELVFEWLLPRAGRASGLTVREAAKPLPEPQRAALLAAHRAR